MYSVLNLFLSLFCFALTLLAPKVNAGVVSDSGNLQSSCEVQLKTLLWAQCAVAFALMATELLELSAEEATSVMEPLAIIYGWLRPI